MKLLFAINVDWYFYLHWMERIPSEMTSGYNVTLCYTQTTEVPSEQSLPLLPLSIQRSSINPFFNFLEFFKARNVLLHHKFNLIHTVTIKPNLYFGIWARLYSIPILFTIPGQGAITNATGVRFKLLQKLICFLYRFAGKNDTSHFIFENKQDREYFLKHKICTNEKSTVVSGAGINLCTFPYTEEKASNRQPVKILFAARLLQGKGLKDLVEATRKINAKTRQVVLYVAGITDTDARDRILPSQLKRWNSSGDIKYLGQVKDMPGLLSDCHIVSLPTRYGEGLPRILLEANACGRPVIATNIAGCNDFIENGINGYLVTPGKTTELVDAIAKLFDPAIRKQMGLAGRRKVERYYSKEHVIQQYRTAYKKLFRTTR